MFDSSQYKKNKNFISPHSPIVTTRSLWGIQLRTTDSRSSTGASIANRRRGTGAAKATGVDAPDGGWKHWHLSSSSSNVPILSQIKSHTSEHGLKYPMFNDHMLERIYAGSPKWLKPLAVIQVIGLWLRIEKPMRFFWKSTILRNPYICIIHMYKYIYICIYIYMYIYNMYI